MTTLAMDSKAESAPQGMKTFLIIWIGQLISILGSGLTGFALGVWIFQQTGKATPFALTVLFGNLPRILLLPIAGSLADRWNRRLVMNWECTGHHQRVCLVVVRQSHALAYLSNRHFGFGLFSVSRTSLYCLDQYACPQKGSLTREWHAAIESGA